MQVRVLSCASAWVVIAANTPPVEIKVEKWVRIPYEESLFDASNIRYLAVNGANTTRDIGGNVGSNPTQQGIM